MDHIEHVKREHANVFRGIDTLHRDLVKNLDSSEREALEWFRRGIKSKNLIEKQSCYSRTCRILGEYVLK